MTTRRHAVMIAFAFVLLAGCGSDESTDASEGATVPAAADCEPPELLDFRINYLEADNADCSTGGAVATAASECLFNSPDFDCPEVIVGGTTWECAFQFTGGSGSGGRSRAVCFSEGTGREEVRFEVERLPET